MIRLKALVVRDGKEKLIDAAGLVKGDLILFKAGDNVSADCYLIEVNELHVNEASLTGESFPARKEIIFVPEDAPFSKRKNSLWQGSSIVSGTAKAVVILTGDETIFGGLVKSVSTSFCNGFHSFDCIALYGVSGSVEMEFL